MAEQKTTQHISQADLSYIHVNDYRGQLLENKQDMAYVHVTTFTLAITGSDIKVKDIQSVLTKHCSVNPSKIHSFRRSITAKPLSPEAKIVRKGTVLMFREA